MKSCVLNCKFELQSNTSQIHLIDHEMNKVKYRCEFVLLFGWFWTCPVWKVDCFLLLWDSEEYSYDLFYEMHWHGYSPVHRSSFNDSVMLSLWACKTVIKGKKTQRDQRAMHAHTLSSPLWMEMRGFWKMHCLWRVMLPGLPFSFFVLHFGI